MYVGDLISKFFDFIRKNSSMRKFLSENKINHYLFSCDLVEYDFNTINKNFNISYFSKNDNLVGNQFVVSKNLKDYESIEESGDVSISILIKKFKLRISFRKSPDFSNKIIISDDYDFNPNFLHHADSIIKIAIVKNNIDEWINSKNFNHYDYIFILGEYFNDFIKNKNIFIIKGETIYEQIKYILNELYKRKLDKFYFFVKSINFHEIFPNYKNYFKVLNSEYFDNQWYRETYNLKENTDSVIHFLLLGYTKYNDPGPNFSTAEYYECNKDVELDGMNPLVHYELYGRKENRIIKISDIGQRDYSLISNSPFFDGDWYKSTYDIDDIDLVEHYLNIGFVKGFNPGPDFSTFQYYECNLDVKDNAMNPLLHYELYGRKENRAINIPDDRYNEFYSSILNSPFFDGDWYKSTYDIGDVDLVEHYLNIGFVKGFNPGPDFSTFEYNECNKDVEDYGLNPLVHYELYGKYEKRMLKIVEMRKRDYSLILDSQFFDDVWYRSTYDLEDNVDSVEHYLYEGFLKFYNPGPDFSTFEYYECNHDVKEWQMNPLLHFELYGKNENRVTNISNEKNEEYRSSIYNSPYFNRNWYRDNYGIGDANPIDHYLKIGFAKGYNPGPDFSTFEYYECNPDVKDYGLNPLVHYELFGRNENRKLRNSNGIS